MKYHDRLSREASKRREKFRKMKESGMSYRRIGEQFGISGQRVQQILGESMTDMEKTLLEIELDLQLIADSEGCAFPENIHIEEQCERIRQLRLSLFRKPSNES